MRFSRKVVLVDQRQELVCYTHWYNVGSTCPRIKLDSILFVIAQCDLYATESDRSEQKFLEFS